MYPNLENITLNSNPLDNPPELDAIRVVGEFK